MSVLVKNKGAWRFYLKLQENRASQLKAVHTPEEPEEYPCFVMSAMHAEGAVVRFVHHFVYVQDALKLINYVSQSKRKKTRSCWK